METIDRRGLLTRDIARPAGAPERARPQPHPFHERLRRSLHEAPQALARLWPWSPAGAARIRGAVARQALALPSYRGPAALLVAGLLLALFATPGPWPGPLTVLSFALAYGAYCLARRLAERGHVAWGAATLVAVALLAVPLAFGPDPVAHRKVTSLNAWAYELGSHLPPILVPAPNPNAVAGLLATALPFAAAAALYAKGSRQHLAVAVPMLAGVSLVITASRTGWLAGAAALCVVAASRYGRRHGLLALCIAGPAIAAFTFLAPNLQSPADLVIRNSLWQETVNLLSRQPITGLGLSRLRQAGIIAESGYGRAALITPHNALLQLWADGGLLGLAALGWLLARMGKTVVALSGERRPELAWAIAGVQGALVAFAVQGLCETNTMFVWQAGAWYEMLSPLPLVLLGFMAGLQRRRVKLAANEQSAHYPLSATLKGSPRGTAPGADRPHRRGDAVGG